MQKIIPLAVIVFFFSLVAMNQEEITTIIQNSFVEKPSLAVNQTINRTEQQSVWVKEFFSLTRSIKIYPFTIGNTWYTLLDFSDQSVIDKYAYRRYVEELAHKEPEKFTIYKLNPEKFIILSHGKWQLFVEKRLSKSLLL